MPYGHSDAVIAMLTRLWTERLEAAKKEQLVREGMENSLALEARDARIVTGALDTLET